MYPILDENYNEFNKKEGSNLPAKLLAEPKKGIIFELADDIGTEPNYDKFYCILTEDKVLKYYNGDVYSGYVNGVHKKLMNAYETPYKDIVKNIFEFQTINKEYTLRLTEQQYKEMISKIKAINSQFIPDETERLPRDFDTYGDIRCLCLSSGYFDARNLYDKYLAKHNDYGLILQDFCGSQNMNSKFTSEREAKIAYKEMFKDIELYIQYIIPDFETRAHMTRE